MRLLAAIGALAIVGAVALAVVLYGGFYNVAAVAGDPAPVAWVLTHVRMASIDHHATVTPPLNLDEPALVQAGAKAFAARGCINCHGGPGAPWAKFSEGLHPGPPDLKDVVNERTPQALFWVIKNGINMTAMPSFGEIEVPDAEIWTIVAFLKKLPSVSNDNFKTWTTAQSQ